MILSFLQGKCALFEGPSAVCVCVGGPLFLKQPLVSLPRVLLWSEASKALVKTNHGGQCIDEAGSY